MPTAHNKNVTLRYVTRRYGSFDLSFTSNGLYELRLSTHTLWHLAMIPNLTNLTKTSTAYNKHLTSRYMAVISIRSSRKRLRQTPASGWRPRRGNHVTSALPSKGGSHEKTRYLTVQYLRSVLGVKRSPRTPASGWFPRRQKSSMSALASKGGGHDKHTSRYVTVRNSTFDPSFALTISTNSGFRLAPPTRKPSMSALAPRVGADPALTLPP